MRVTDAAGKSEELQQVVEAKDAELSAAVERHTDLQRELTRQQLMLAEAAKRQKALADRQKEQEADREQQLQRRQESLETQKLLEGLVQSQQAELTKAVAIQEQLHERLQ